MTEIQDDSLHELRLKYPPIIIEDTRIPTLNYDENEPRLIISEILNENFKSYGGIRKLGPFHKNFTCVIGPNGSGKSNVIDALLFVFGFRASKIRSKKLSVLIHKSELFPNVQSCTVKVYFQRIIPTGDGDDDFEIVKDSEFVVSRTAFKDNSNIYKINEKKAGTKEVADFLRNQGIDLDHNRFLILQGEVEQISLMKPKAINEYDDGLLEYLEDIIGSNRFKKPIKQLHERLEELCDLRMEKLNRVKVVEKEKKDLEGVRNDALRYLRLCNEITIRKNIAFQIKCREFLLFEKNAKEKVDECQNEMNAILEDIKKINDLKITKEKFVKEIAQQYLIKMQEFEMSKKRFTELEIEDAALRDSRKHCRSTLENTKKLIKSKEAELVKYENVPAESIVRIEQLKKEIADLEKIKIKETSNQEKAQADLKEETKESQQLLDEKSAILRKEEERLTIQEKKITAIKCERDILLSNHTKEEEKLTSLDSNLKSLKESVNRDKDILRRLKDDLPKMEKEFAKLSKELDISKKVLQTVQQEIQEIQQQLDSGSSFEVEERTVKFLFEQQSQGKVNNVVGRLGDLGSVDPKYDVALSTACGRLDSIVTETIDDAQRCVELMKQFRISKASFIAMDKVNHWGAHANIVITIPQDASRAFDLLNIPDKRHRAVFYFSFQNLLVSIDINKARGINNGIQKKFRIVTLKGELIEISGAMTGGGNRVIRGKISTNADKVVAAANKRDQSKNTNKPELELKLREKKLEYDQLLQLISKLKPQLDELNLSIEGGRRQKKTCDEQLQPSAAKESSLMEEIEKVKENIRTLKPNNAQVAQFDKSLKELNAIYDKDLTRVVAMRTAAKKLVDDISNMGIAKLGTIKSRLDSVIDKIKEKSETFNKISQSVKQAEKICLKTTVGLEKLSEEKQKLEENVIAMDKTMAELDKRAKDNVEEYKKTSIDIEKLVKIKEEREKELTDSNEEYKKLDCSRKQIQRMMEEKTEKWHQITRNLNQVQANLEKLKLYSMPDDCESADNESFADILGKGCEDMIFYSAQPNSHCGQKLKTYSDEELTEFDRTPKMGHQDLEDKVNKQKPNLTAIEDYRLKEELYMQRAAELTEVTEIRDTQRRQAEQLKKQRLDEFLAGFNLITGKLKEMYQLITMGGDAELELVDTLDPFSEGIVFSVRPPKKSWKNISNLSGGEKTLSSLALVFALHHFKPTPFYVMDEIDAALDFKNVSIVANYIKERTRNAQFIIISLRNNMYELSDRLVGICKPFNFSKTCVLNPKSLEKCLSAHSNVLKEHVNQMFRVASLSQPSSQVPSTQTTVVSATGNNETQNDEVELL